MIFGHKIYNFQFIMVAPCGFKKKTYFLVKPLDHITEYRECQAFCPVVRNGSPLTRKRVLPPPQGGGVDTLVDTAEHLSPVSLTPLINIHSRLSLQIFEKSRNDPNGILRGPGDTDS